MSLNEQNLMAEMNGISAKNEYYASLRQLPEDTDKPVWK